MQLKKGQIKLLVVSGVALAAVTSALACPFCKIRTTGVFIGETVVMGNGTARSWVDIGKDKKPKAIGVTFNKLALQNLGPAGEDGMGPEFVLKFPEQVKDTPFNHISVDWNPNGHEPAGVYDVPHFDFHFYMIKPTDRSQITLEGDDLKKCQLKPDPSFVPAKYIYAPKTEIKYMGAHWVDVTSPELAGKPFTSTFIYGSYAGKYIFLEPMVALSYLQSVTVTHTPITLPKNVAQPGYYPSQYTIAYDPTREEYTVSLDQFVWLGKPKSAVGAAKPAKR